MLFSIAKILFSAYSKTCISTQSSALQNKQKGTPFSNFTTISKFFKLYWRNNLSFSISNTLSINWIFFLSSLLPNVKEIYSYTKKNQIDKSLFLCQSAYQTNK